MKREPERPSKPTCLPPAKEKPSACTPDRERPLRPSEAPPPKPRDPRRYQTREMRPRRG